MSTHKATCMCVTCEDRRHRIERLEAEVERLNAQLTAAADYDDAKDREVERLQSAKGAQLSLLKDIQRQLHNTLSGEAALGDDLYRELCSAADESVLTKDSQS